MATDFAFTATFLGAAGALAGLTIFEVAFLAGRAAAGFGGLTILVDFAGAGLAAGTGAVTLAGSAAGCSGVAAGTSFGTSVLTSDYV
jgi:hypothetical protein